MVQDDLAQDLQHSIHNQGNPNQLISLPDHSVEAVADFQNFCSHGTFVISSFSHMMKRKIFMNHILMSVSRRGLTASCDLRTWQP